MRSDYRRLVPKLSVLIDPLNVLTRNNVRVKLTDSCQQAFVFFNDKLTSVSMLAYPDLNKPYNLYTDASNLVKMK